MDNDPCDYRAPHGERCVLIYGHTYPHVIAPGDVEPGMDMDVATEFTCHSCGTLVTSVMEHVHLQFHEYVVGLQNRLTDAERRLAQLQNEITTVMRNQGGGKSHDKIYPDAYGRYSRDNVIEDEPWIEEAGYGERKTVKRTGLTPKRKRDLIRGGE